MSYTLIVWEGVHPSSDEAAMATHDELMDRYFGVDAIGDEPPASEPPTRAIADFLKALLEHWPDIGEPGGEDSPWADGPMANNASGPIICFSITTDGLAEAVPFVVEEAERLGLVCFDEQGPPFLLTSPPTGTETGAKSPRKPPEKRTPPTVHTLRQVVSDLLVEQGYRREGQRLVRRIDGDFCSVVDVGRLFKGTLDIAPWIGIHHHGVDQLVADLHERPRPDESSATVGSNVGYVTDGTYRKWIDADDPSGAQLLAIQPTFLWGNPQVVLTAIAEARTKLDEYASLDRLPGAFEIPGADLIGHFTLAAIYLLLGDEPAVCKWLVQGELRDCRQEGPVCEQFRRFERNVLARMSPDAASALERQRAEAMRARQAKRPASFVDRLLARVQGTSDPSAS